MSDFGALTVVVPRGAEERAVRRALARTGPRVRVVTMGIGPIAADRAVRDADLSASSAVLVTGLCGALAPGLRVGDPVIYGAVVSESARVVLDGPLAAELGRSLPSAQSGITALASSQIVTSAREKRRLGREFAAQTVDMESLAAISACVERGITCGVMRVVSDAVGDDLPSLDRALDGSGGLDALALALVMLRQPLSGIRMARNGTRALAALEQHMAAIGRVRRR